MKILKVRVSKRLQIHQGLRPSSEEETRELLNDTQKYLEVVEIEPNKYVVSYASGLLEKPGTIAFSQKTNWALESFHLDNNWRVRYMPFIGCKVLPMIDLSWVNQMSFLVNHEENKKLKEFSISNNYRSVWTPCKYYLIPNETYTLHEFPNEKDGVDIQIQDNIVYIVGIRPNCLIE